MAISSGQYINHLKERNPFVVWDGERNERGSNSVLRPEGELGHLSNCWDNLCSNIRAADWLKLSPDYSWQRLKAFPKSPSCHTWLLLQLKPQHAHTHTEFLPSLRSVYPSRPVVSICLSSLYEAYVFDSSQ